MLGFSNDRSLMYWPATLTWTGGGVVWTASSGLPFDPLPN